jgi:light-independent protochlorophyllide reductase subunit B
LVASEFDPTTEDELLEALSEGVPWTSEALQRLDNIPPFARSFARKATDDYAREEGCQEVTLEVLAAARQKLGM